MTGWLCVTQVLHHRLTPAARRKPFEETKDTLEAFKVVEWGVIQLRHNLSHELASTQPLLVSQGSELAWPSRVWRDAGVADCGHC